MPEKEQPMQARCLYDILGLPRDCTQEQIRSAYKRLALQLHPDKLIATGTISEEEATSNFQALLNAYQVLSDPRERAFYDSHRSQILFSDPNSTSSSFGGPHVDVSHLFHFFFNSAFSSFTDTGKGFYKVYADIFGKIYAQEVSFAKELELGLDEVGQAPTMGNLESPYEQVSAFYSFWLGFSTVMDFSWVEPYHASAGPSRKARRVMEDENKKARKKARKEYNETVRGLAEFVKKRDKRVIEMQMKRKLEEENRRAVEKERKKEEARKKMEKIRMYEAPEWARNEEVEEEEAVDDDFDERDDGKKKAEKELYCVVCSKKFKSEKQWKNHEQSKKHREKIEELRNSYKAEEGKDESDEEGEEEEVLVDGVGQNPEDNVGMDDDIDDLSTEFRDVVGIREEGSGAGSNMGNEKGREEGGDSFGSDDEESILEAMISDLKNRKNANEHQTEPLPTSSSTVYGVDDDIKDEPEFLEYDMRKSNRRSQQSKKVDGAKSSMGTARVKADGCHEQVKSVSVGSETLVDEDTADGIPPLRESSSHSFEDARMNGAGDKLSRKNQKVNNQSQDTIFGSQRQANIKSKNSSKGKKQKALSNLSGLACETCGENFESRNKLHVHLGATGHAVLKSR